MVVGIAIWPEIGLWPCAALGIAGTTGQGSARWTLRLLDRSLIDSEGSLIRLEAEALEALLRYDCRFDPTEPASGP